MGTRSTALGNGTWPRCRPEGDNVIMTMPSPDDDEREAGPLGSEVAPPGDEESQGGSGDSVAGPSYPPAETEPDA
jgi:hypothetical protein